MRFYFVRHGQSEANVIREFSNRGLKHPLTPLGREQALALAERLRGGRYARLYASPLLRAQETARILSAALGLPVETTDALREFDTGVFEGRPLDEGLSLYEEVVRDWLERGQPDSRMEGGESLNDIRARFVPFVERLVRERDGQDGDVILVGHGGLYRVVMHLVCANLSASFTLEQGLGNCEYVMVETTPTGLRCEEWCGTPIDS